MTGPPIDRTTQSRTVVRLGYIDSILTIWGLNLGFGLKRYQSPVMTRGALVRYSIQSCGQCLLLQSGDRCYAGIRYSGSRYYKSLENLHNEILTGSYHIQYWYTNTLSYNLTICTKKKLSLRRIETDNWFYTEAVIVLERYLQCSHRTASTVIVSSSAFWYIDKTTPKINEYQQLHSEPVSTTEHLTADSL